MDGIDISLKANVISAILHPGQVNLSQPSYNCPTGNCTWDRISTFGFCPQCIDISEHLGRKCKHSADKPYCIAQFPNTPANVASVIPNLGTHISGIFSNLIPEKGETLVLKNATVYPLPVFQSIRAVTNPDITSSPGARQGTIQNDTRLIGTECAMIPCVQSIKASVENGFYTESIVETRYSTSAQGVWDGNITLHSPGEGKKDFGFDFQTYRAFRDTRFFSEQLVGMLIDIDAGSSIWSTSDNMLAMFYANFTEANCDTPEGSFACTFKAIGRGLTKAIRDASMPPNGPFSPDVAIGKVLVTTTFVRVEWMWLSLPVFVWVLSCVTWMGSVWKTRKTRVPLWRSNVLPLVFLYREKGRSEMLMDFDDGRGDSSFAYELRSEELKVRLRRQGMHFKLKED